MVVRVCTPSGFLYDGLSDKYKTKEKKKQDKKRKEFTCGSGPLQSMAVTSLNLISTFFLDS